MAALPEPNHTTVAKIYKAYEDDAESGNRPHLGASLIGRSCERQLWLTFRWVDSKKFSGRMLQIELCADVCDLLLKHARVIFGENEFTTRSGSNKRGKQLFIDTEFVRFQQIHG